jgi:hypothetical protein
MAWQDDNGCHRTTRRIDQQVLILAFGDQWQSQVSGCVS